MKREEVKALAPGLTEEQLDGIMRMNGADIESLKGANATLSAQLEGTKTQLAEANGKLEGYDPEWKAKAGAAAAAADRRVKELEAGFAAERAAGELRFSSGSARRAFLADLAAKALPVQEGSLLGFDDFVKAYRQQDPGAFAPEGPQPQFAAAAPGTPVPPSGKEAANAAFRSILNGG